MTRKTRVAVGTIFTLAVIAGASYQALLPKWVTATQAEVDRVIDPILLEEDPPDPAAEERYIRLAALLKDLKHPPTAKLEGPVANLRALLLEGPYRRTDRGPMQSEFSENSKTLVKGLALLIEDSSSPLPDRTASVELGQQLARRQFQDSRSIDDYMASLGIAAIIDRSAMNLLAREHLPENEAKLLLAHLPDLESESRPNRAIKGEFRENAYRYLPDPIAYYNRIARKDSTITYFETVLSDSTLRNEEPDPDGNYDALQAAKLFSDLTVEQLRNCDLPSSKLSTPVADRVNKVVKSFPREYFGWSKGFKLWILKEKYRAQMARIPNSFAYTFVPPSPLRLVVRAREVLLARDRLLRTHLSCDIYVSRKGHLPPALSDLVSAGILPAVPLDPFDQHPMRYDPKRKLLWSIGYDGKDDRGSEVKSPHPPADMVAHLRGSVTSP